MEEKKREFEYTWDDFNSLRELSNRHSGILVPDDKFDMFYSRLSKRLRALKLNNFREYRIFLTDPESHEFTEFINAITTNLTSFFRENHHFDFLKATVIPELLQKNRTTKTITAWSAGCSTGEESYSIAITLAENLPGDWTFKILATDLDTNVLATASNGIYPFERVENLDQACLKKWFKRGTGSRQNLVKVSPGLAANIHFRQLNLVRAWPMKFGFDFIFCRNVFIYFDAPTKTDIVERFSERLPPNGCLFVGHSESLAQLTDRVRLIGQTVYRKTA